MILSTSLHSGEVHDHAADMQGEFSSVPAWLYGIFDAYAASNICRNVRLKGSLWDLSSNPSLWILLVFVMAESWGAWLRWVLESNGIRLNTLTVPSSKETCKKLTLTTVLAKGFTDSDAKTQYAF